MKPVAKKTSKLVEPQEKLEPVLEMLVQAVDKNAEALKSLGPIQSKEISDGETVTIVGKKPVKGVDYYTDADKKELLDALKSSYQQPQDGHTPTPDELLNLIRPLIPAKANDGHTPTDDELKALIESVMPDVEDGHTPTDEELLALITPLIPKRGEPGKPGKNGSPDTGAQIVKKINSQQNDKDNTPEKISTDMIEDLEIFVRRRRNDTGYLRELSDVELPVEPTGPYVLTWNIAKKKWVAQVSQGGASISVPLAADISTQFDGVTTTFTIPAYSAILMFIITGWPPNGALRPTTDFTTPSNTTVSLVAGQVDAPQSGVTGIILYVPA